MHKLIILKYMELVKKYNLYQLNELLIGKNVTFYSDCNLFNNFKVTGKVVSISVASNGEYLFKVKIKNGKTYDIGSNMHNLSFEI